MSDSEIFRTKLVYGTSDVSIFCMNYSDFCKMQHMQYSAYH